MKKVFLFIALCSTLASFSQHKSIDSISQLNAVYQDYFSPLRESVYLQLNKTKVIPSENVWFSAYAYNPKTMMPSKTTTNLHVNLYNAEGQLKNAKTIYINQGTGRGFFKLDTLNYKPGHYMIKAFTKLMKNYDEELSFKQPFEILGKVKPAQDSGSNYDLQILPEGGHLIANTKNTIGVKLINDRGQSQPFKSGKLLNAKSDVVTTFKSNRFGLGKFRTTVNIKKEYTVEVRLKNDTTIRTPLPAPKLKGLALSVNNLVNTNFYISLTTNSTTLSDIAGHSFYVVLHTPRSFQSIPFVFPADKKKVTLPFDKKLLNPGVNIITVFDENFNPIAERQIFHREAALRRHADLRLLKNSGDSIAFNLEADLEKEANFSISVLPADTKAYTPDHDILSAFLIKPYIRGHLDDGAYYFSSGQKRKKNFDLDLLLLTQGWSQYEWRNIFNGKPRELYKPEHGFVVSGKVNFSGYHRKGDQLMLKDTVSNLFQIADLDKKNRFSIDNLYILDSTNISFGVINKKKSKIEEPKIYARITPLPDTKNISIDPERFNPNRKEERSKPRHRSINELIAKANVLKEIIVIGDRSKSDLKSKYRHRSSFITGQKIVIDKDAADIYHYITDLIQANGFRVNRSMTGVSIQTLGAVTSHGPASPQVVLDGGDLGGDLSPLLTLKTSEVEAIYINKTGYGLGINGAGGAIQIFTKMGSGNFGKRKSYITTRKRLMKNGFARHKTFYTPKYTNYTIKWFDDYGAIDWFPDLKFDAGEKFKTLKILNTGQTAVRVFIAGMTSNGHLISENIKLKTR